MNNLKSQSYKINRTDFEKRNQHRGFALWFVGLSGSGKSTLANGLQAKLFENGFNVTDVKDGRKKDTLVATVKFDEIKIPTLLVEHL